MKKKFNYENISEGYYDAIHDKNEGIQSAWHHNKFEFITSLIKDRSSHLDIGCGPGTFVGNYLDKKFDKTLGVDISINQINFAKKKYPKSDFKLISKDKLPFKDGSFDSISLIELIEHLDQKEINFLMKEAIRCLKKDGLIYITTPNYLSLWPLLEFIVNKLSPLSYEDQHISKFTSSRLKKLGHKLNLKIIKIGSFNFIAPFAAFLSWGLFKKISSLEKKIDFKYGNLLYIILKK